MFRDMKDAVGKPYFAAAISLVLHSRSPMVRRKLVTFPPIATAHSLFCYSSNKILNHVLRIRVWMVKEQEREGVL